MRQRDAVHLDKVTMEVSVKSELLPDASVEERFGTLVDSIPPNVMANAEIVISKVRCDGCQTTADIDMHKPVLPQGWITNEKGEFCPECSFEIG